MNRKGTLATLLVAMAVLFRVLMPDGFMPEVGKDNGLTLVLCSAGPDFSASQAETQRSADQKAALDFLAGQSQPEPADRGDVCDYFVLHWAAVPAEPTILLKPTLEPSEAAPVPSAQVWTHRLVPEGNPRAPPRA